MNNGQGVINGAYDSGFRNNLKSLTPPGSQGSASQIAKQFEAKLIQTMLENMHESVLFEDDVFDNNASMQYPMSIACEHIANQISKAGIGLAGIIAKKISLPSAPDKSVSPLTKTLDNMEWENRLAIQQVSNEWKQRARRTIPAIPYAATELSSKHSGFIASLAHSARQISSDNGIPHHLILAQAALETQWGQRQILTREGKPSYNLFAIKANDSWQGEKTEITTTEYENGQAKKVQRIFRVYNSYAEAFADYADFLRNNPRYMAVINANSAEQGAMALQQAGYATDPNYAQKLIKIIKQFTNTDEKVMKTYQGDVSKLL